MATDLISIKDPASANKWLMEVMALNERYHQAMEEASNTLIDMQEFSEGTMVDEFVNLGNGLLNAAEATFNAINEISTVVNNVLTTVSDIASNVVGGITKAISSLLG